MVVEESCARPESAPNRSVKELRMERPTRVFVSAKVHGSRVKSRKISRRVS